MNTLQLQPGELNLKYPKLDFVNLKGNIFAEYQIIYRINDCYNITDLNKVTGKHQLLFQKFESKIQQLNLIIVDSIFSNILADITLEVLLKKISTFNDYVDLTKKEMMISRAWDRKFYRYKFQTLIHYFAFSNIHTHEVCMGEIYTDRVYYKKSSKSGIDYYPIYCLHQFQEMLLAELNVKVNYSKSYIFNQEANVCLELVFD